MRARVEIGRDGPELLLRFYAGGEHFERALADLKARVPAGSRSWDAEARCWRVDDDFERELTAWASVWFPEQAAPRPAGPALDEAYQLLWLRPGAPPEVVRAAYRALAASHHPDRGGSEAAMKALNRARDLLADQLAAEAS